MSGLLTFLPGFGPNYAGQVSHADLDQYDLVAIDNPTVNAAWYGSASGTVTTSTAITQVNKLADWPRNVLYSITGITNGTYGGTFTVNLVDQFGSAATEVVSIGTAVNGGSTFGSVVAMKFLSGSFI